VLAHLKHGDLKAQVLIQALRRLVGTEHRQANGQDIHLATLSLGRRGYRPTIAAPAKFLAHLDPITEGVKTVRPSLQMQPEVTDGLVALRPSTGSGPEYAHPPAAGCSWSSAAWRRASGNDTARDAAIAAA